MLPFNSNFAIGIIADFLKEISDDQIKTITCSQKAITFEFRDKQYTLKLIKHR